MIRLILAALAFFAFTSATPASEPVPKESLLAPPLEATRYVIVSDTNTHGDEWRWETEEGAIAFRKSQSLRGWITETDARVTLCDDGAPCQVEIRGVTPSGDAARSTLSRRTPRASTHSAAAIASAAKTSHSRRAILANGA